MNNNLYLLLMMTAALLAISLAVYMLWPDDDSQTELPTALPTLPTDGGLPTDNQPGGSQYVFFETPAGEISMRDPRSLPGVTDFSSGLYSVTDIDQVMEQSFSAVFNANNNSLAVSLNREPLTQTRLEAEAYLMATLELTQGELCSINSFVSAPHLVNPFFAGDNLGFSFCPGSVALE